MLHRVKQEFASRGVFDTLSAYIRVPNMSPSFDKECLSNGLQDQALGVLVDWLQKQRIRGLTYEVCRLDKRTPLLFCDIPASPEYAGPPGDVALLYGHFDKQPPFEGWNPGTGPYTPVVKDGRLYGRGAADDGYSLFSAIVAIAACQVENKPHPRAVIMIEGCEESGSPDLPFYMSALSSRIGTPSLVVCLDSGAGNYDQLWVTSSLRGILVGDLKVSVLSEGVHSGDASGVVPSSFRIARSLLSRLEDEATGEIKLRELFDPATFDTSREQAAHGAGKILGVPGMISCFPFLEATQPLTVDVGQLAVNRWWKPYLEVIGAAGLPASETAGNVLRPFTQLTLSLRLPPHVDKVAAQRAVEKVLLEGPMPNHAKVEFNVRKASQGWCAPKLSPWLERALQDASGRNFARPAVFQGEGGSIPFMAMLGNMYPQAQFFVTGVLGPQANAHGPNEFLHMDFVQKVTACVADVLVSMGTRNFLDSEEEARAVKTARISSDQQMRDEFTRNHDGSKV